MAAFQGKNSFNVKWLLKHGARKTEKTVLKHSAKKRNYCHGGQQYRSNLCVFRVTKNCFPQHDFKGRSMKPMSYLAIFSGMTY